MAKRRFALISQSTIDEDDEIITGKWTFENDVDIDNGKILSIFDSTDTDKGAFSHDGTDFNLAFTNTTDWNITGLTGDILPPSGRGVKLFSGSGAQVSRHDGTDVNTTHASTTDWNISGITAIKAGAVDADFDAITATTYGGITEANLLDKAASAVIIGAREWQGNIGFYSTTPISQQTGVAVTAAGIHTALVNLGLITA